MNHKIKLKLWGDGVWSLPLIEFDGGSFYFDIGSFGGYWPISAMKYRLEKTFGEWK